MKTRQDVPLLDRRHSPGEGRSHVEEEELTESNGCYVGTRRQILFVGVGCLFGWLVFVGLGSTNLVGVGWLVVRCLLVLVGGRTLLVGNRENRFTSSGRESRSMLPWWFSSVSCSQWPRTKDSSF